MHSYRVAGHDGGATRRAHPTPADRARGLRAGPRTAVHTDRREQVAATGEAITLGRVKCENYAKLRWHSKL